MADTRNDVDMVGIRAVIIYSTSLSYRGEETNDLTAVLKLGGLKPHYQLYRDQLPRLLPKELLGPAVLAGDIRLDRPLPQVDTLHAMLFALPSQQIVLVVTFGFACRATDMTPVVSVLEQSIEAGLKLGQMSLRDYVNGLADHADIALDGLTSRAPSNPDEPTDALLPERHQLVFMTPQRPDQPPPTATEIQRILYRATPPYSEEFARPKRPEQLNKFRRANGPEQGTGIAAFAQIFRPLPDPEDIPITLGVVTPYVSLFFKQQLIVEDSILLSTVHAVGTASRFRDIWHEAYLQVRRFREFKQRQDAGIQTRADLEELTDNLGNLEFDLTFSVEFPLMRIESFQTALYEAMDLSAQAKTLSQMFQEIRGSLQSESTAIDVRERRRDEARQRWNAFAASILSLLGVSVGFVIAFLGTNVTEVPSDREAESMWSAHYAPLYLIAGLTALTPAFLILFPYLRDWTKLALGDGPHQHKVMVWILGPVITVVGVGLTIGAYVVDRIGPAGMRVPDAIGKAFGFFAVAVGLSATLQAIWYRTKASRRRRSDGPASIRSGPPLIAPGP